MSIVKAAVPGFTKTGIKSIIISENAIINNWYN